MNPFYTTGDVPEGRPFTIEGINLILRRDGTLLRMEPTPETTTFDAIKMFCVDATTETELLRPLYAIDQTKVVGSFLNTYLTDTGDGYILETFDEDGEVHFARYFRPENLHRAVSALQQYMPEQIPEWANTEITRPNGVKQYSPNDVYGAIRDTFFIGYGFTQPDVENMELVLGSDGWDFNDLNQEQSLCSTEET